MRKLADKNIRKIFKSGHSYAITLPREMINKLNWQEKQRVAVKMNGRSVIIRDWQ